MSADGIGAASAETFFINHPNKPTHMSKNLQHLQTDEPIMPFEDWLVELATLIAKEFKIDRLSAMRRISIDEAHEWWQDGFTPFATFRENG